ncbi:ribonuclease H-like domain-containing protein [Tanacetum coccineum]
MCDKKNNVLFTDTECLVLSFDFKLLDESQVLLRVSRKDNIYSVDLKSVVLTRGLTCLFAKAIIDESNIWHRRLGHINYKTMNKLVRGNLVRGLPSKIFENDHSCVACQKGKQHKASYKTKLVNSIIKPLHMLHMDLFGPTNVKSLMKKSYYLVVTDDFRIKREFSVARTPQQNGIAEMKNRTLIEATRTMLVNSKLSTTLWAFYVLNRALVIKPHNKTPYERIRGRPPPIDFMKPFRYPITILNTRDHLSKFDGKADEGFFYWVFCGHQANDIARNRDNIVAGQAEKEKEPAQEYILIPLCITDPLISQDPKDSKVDAGKKAIEVDESGASNKGGNDEQATRSEFERLIQKEMQTEQINSTNSINTASTPVSTAGPSFANVGPSSLVNTARTFDSTANAFEEYLFE